MCFLHDSGDITDVSNHVVMLGNRAADLHHRSLLECIAANHCLRNLPGDADHRNTVQFGVGNARDQIGRAGATGPHHNPNLTCRASNALSRETSTLLVARKNCANPVTMLPQRLMQRHAGATRIRIDIFGAQAYKHFHKNLGTIDRLSRFFHGSQRRHPS